MAATTPRRLLLRSEQTSIHRDITIGRGDEEDEEIVLGVIGSRRVLEEILLPAWIRATEARRASARA